MKCPKCGNNVPDGSAFCNQCGTPLNSDIQCPSCNSSIPANSVFCPVCGKMVRNDMAEGETFNQQQARLRREAEVQAARQQQQQPDPWKQPQTDDEATEVAAAPKSTYNRNVLIGIGIIVGIIALLLIMRTCNSSNDRAIQEAMADTTAMTMIDGQDPLALFNSEMGRSSYMGDGANTAFAVAFPQQNEVPGYVMGVTYQSNPSSRSFFKIYKLTQNGSAWVVEPVHTQYVNGRSINFDNASLIASPEQTPRAVKVDGKDYLYFAYMNMPQGAHVGSTGRVSLCLYDAAAHKLTTLDYDGIIKIREDGRQYVYGKPLQSINSTETRFLQQEAQSIKVIYFPTQEELDAEKEEQEEAEEEASLEGPENAGAKWSHDNAGKIASVKGGEEVSMRAQSYDSPIFKMENKNKKIENADYIVFSDNKGAVYGFNKSSRKYFVIYTPSNGSAAPSEIGFADSENSILNLRTGEGRFQYNLKTDKMKSNND